MRLFYLRGNGSSIYLKEACAITGGTMDYLTLNDLGWVKSVALATLLVVSISALKAGKLIPKKRIRPLPPGPPGLPVIGNILDVPRDEFWWKYKEWSDQYGPCSFYLFMLYHRLNIFATSRIGCNLSQSLRPRRSCPQFPRRLQGTLGETLVHLFIEAGHADVKRLVRRCNALTSYTISVILLT